MSKKLDNLNPIDYILIKGAALHNLKNIDMAIPRNKLIVITGLSGSGKSSLAFDTLYAEGQRRYVESLSSYARQFLGKLNKPKVDYIKGISPAIAIEQKVNSTNPRSTVGTSTEIYDYLKLLFARIGKTYSPISNQEVKKDKIEDVINFIKELSNDSKLLLLAPIKLSKDKNIDTYLNVLVQQGYSRIKINDTVTRLKTPFSKEFIQQISKSKTLFIVVDRIVTQQNEDFYNRLADSVQTTFYEGHGLCTIENLSDNKIRNFSNKFELDNITFLEPNTHFFSFNNPYGACSKCEGHGNIIGIDTDLVIPNSSLSIYNDAIVPWRTERFAEYKENLILASVEYGIPIHKPYYELSNEQKSLIWNGTKSFKGINHFFDFLEKKSYKIQFRVMLSRYRGKTICTTCQGNRLRKETDYVKIGGKNISELVQLPLDELLVVFNDLKLNKYDTKVAKRLLVEIKNRLQFLNDVGLNYLNLNRPSNTLSGGESQRINLATSLGSSLVGSMYILDEPSIGLHPKDTKRLIKVLKNLRDLGNTVIVVEHDEDIMAAADYIFDIGPEAGVFGGELVAEGTWKQILKSNSLTAQYLNGKQEIAVPLKRRTSKNYIKIIGARENNLKNIDVTFPLNALSVVTGVSGSGKSTLVKKILFPAVHKKINDYSSKAGEFTKIEGSFDQLKQVEFIDQNPIGRSSRSNPITYIKAYDDIRALFANQQLSNIRNFRPKHFSFNVDGGRCETCKGEGQVTVEMQFMADVHLTCETCKGKRFKKEVLEVKYNNKSISDILDLSIDEAMTFFTETDDKRLVKKIKPLQDVGLGYVQLGQASSTLSGGEAQRIKLASFLIKGSNAAKTLFIFDEPTTGLHFHDIKKLIKSFHALINNGHTIIVVEHNIELIKVADYIIDLGLEGGKNDGQLIFQGTPENLIKNKHSLTAPFLKEKF